MDRVALLIPLEKTAMAALRAEGVRLKKSTVEAFAVPFRVLS